MLPLEITRFLRSATVLSQCAAALLVCTACANDITCIDLANCVYPEADAGSSDTNASAQSPASGEPTSTTSDDGQESALTSPASHDTSASPSAATSDGDDGQPTSGDPSSNDATSNGATSSDPAIGNCLENGACECEEGTTGSCWETPDGAPITAHPEDAIGDCKLGKRTCEGGAWSACIGAIAPQEKDSCDRPLADDNCNGEVNEDCDCTPSDTRACGTDEGPCVAGVQTCQADGTWQPLCVGEVPPLANETCAVVDDANCNGDQNDGCECVGNEAEDCNDCGRRRCNPNTGRWGACEANEQPRCSDDATGILTCDAQGNWQTQECGNADEVHCSVACVVAGNSPSCTVTAKDEDEDSYRSAKCAAAPGNDCDDTQDTVSPGSAEVCDGVDNDCDGKADLADGLALVGSIKTISNRSRVAVTPTNSGFFALVGTSATDQGLFYGSVNASGTGTFGATPFFTPPVTDEVYHHPQIAWAGGLGVIYSTEGPGGKFANAGITVNGSTWVDMEVPAEGTIDYPRLGDITARAQGDLLMVGVRPTNDTIYLSTHSEQGEEPMANSTDITGSLDSYLPHLASNGENSGLIWQTTAPRALNWSLVSATLEFGQPEELSTSAFYADVSSIEAGYAIAWIEGAGFRFMIKNTNGGTECTSNVVPFGTVAANQEVAIADSAHGPVVVATSPDSNAVHLYRFDADCDVLDNVAVSTNASAPKAPSVARSGTNLVIYWTEGSSGRYRFVSDQLCH